MPVLGKPTALVFLAAQFLLRDRSAEKIPALVVFAGLSATYAAYIIGRALLSGPGAMEPVLDVLPLLVVAGLAAWTIRAPVQINIQRLFQATTILLIAVFCLALFERLALGIWRPQLLLGNPLNLTPLLLFPILFVTMDRYAPSRLWIWIGLIAFCLGAYVIGGLSQSRGLFLGLWVLVLVRVAFGLRDAAAWHLRVWRAMRVLLASGLVIAAVATDPMVSGRYQVMSETLTAQSAQPEWSTGLRLALLEGGIEAARERPIFGHGPQFRTIAAQDQMDERYRVTMTHLHNDYLTHLVAGGLPALLLLIALLGTPAFTGWQGNAGLPGSQRRARQEIGTLSTLCLMGVAAVNNVLFVDISAFTTAMSCIAVLLILETLMHSESNADV